jgi:hypothetical protein
MTIVGNDGRNLVVEDPNGGDHYQIPDSDIVEIRHPGAEAMTGGGLLAAVGTLAAVGLVASRNEPCDRQTRSAGGCDFGDQMNSGFRDAMALAVVVTMVAPGVGALAWGASARSESKRRAEPGSAVAITPAPVGAGPAVTLSF